MRFIKKLQYNSPVILTYAIVSLSVLLLGSLTGQRSTSLLFSVYRSPPNDPLTYVRLLGHALGHADFEHYFNNFVLILLIGPLMEEKYGSRRLLLMMSVTAVVTGLLNVILFPNIALLGASGVVFMLILLSAYVNIKKGRLPLTLVLIVLVFIGREIVTGLTVTDNISHLTHVAGGCCGAALGFIFNKRKFTEEETVTEEEKKLTGKA